MKFSTWLRAEWDRVAGFGLVGAGALFVLLGYLGVRNTPFVAEQMAYIASGGIGGLFCLGFGVGLLLTADLHDEWRKLDRLEAELRGDVTGPPDTDSDLTAEPDVGSVAAPPPAERDPGSPSPADRRFREPVPQASGTVGALAMAADRPAGGSRPALAVVTLILLLPLAVAGAGWRRASQTGDFDVAAHGLGWGVAAAAAALALISAWALWMRASVLRRRAVVIVGLRRLSRTRASGRATPGPFHPASDGAMVFVAPGHGRFHRGGCPMLEWLEADAVPEAEADPGLSGCGLCAAP